MPRTAGHSLRSSAGSGQIQPDGLQAELDLHRRALDCAATHFMIVDVSGGEWRIVFANRAIAESFGYEVADLLHQSPLTLLATEQNLDSVRQLREAVHNRTAASAE